jgi:hypothetical protein
MSGDRERLPARRRCSTRNFQHAGARFAVTVGYFEDGRIGEVFISGERPGSGLDLLAHDASIILSIGLQFGADLQTLRHGLTKDHDGSPATLLGSALAALAVVDIGGVPV